MKKISIIIPMYNVSLYLNKCVESVMNQNFNIEDFEIIMINDESPDDSLEVAEGLALQNESIKVFSQKNRGLGGARNTGVKHATGEYIFFLDADDWLLPNSIAPIIDIAIENNLDILEFGANSVSEKGNIIDKVAISSNSKVFNGIDYYEKYKYLGSACNKLYSRGFLEANKLSFLEKVYGEDFEFNTRTLFYATRVCATDLIPVSFLQSSNSITRNSDKKIKDKYLLDFIVALKSISTFKTNNLGLKEDSKKAERFFNERLTLINIDAFYMLFKNNYSYNKIIEYRNKLKSNNLFFVSHEVANKEKNIFRKIMLKFFFLFFITQPLKVLISKMR